MKYFLTTACLLSFFAASCSTGSQPMNPKNDTTSGPHLVRSDYQPGEITQLCKAAIDRTEEGLKKITQLAAGKRTIDNTLLAFETLSADISDAAGELAFMGQVSTDEKLREEGSHCEEEMGKYGVSIFTRKELYLAIKDAQPRTPAEKRLLTETIKRFELNGLKLPDAQLALVKQKLQRMAVLESQFSANLANDVSALELSAEELAGTPASFLERLKKTADGKKYIVTTKAPDYKAVMETANVAETRRKMLFAYLNRAAEKNTEILNEVLALRRETAALLGYKTWADYKTEPRMAKSSAAVLDFLNSLKTKLSAKNKKDLAQLLKFKKELDPSATGIKMWDINYLAYQLKKRDFSIDDEKIREYFPTDKVLAGIFDIYSKLLNVQFIEVKNAKTWAPEVKLYEIVDRQTREVLSYFYADLYPRTGKYGHFAAFSLVLGRQLSTGYSKPVSALVGNFNPPSQGKPSLLNHSDVETLFHEFGHIMHQTLTRAPYASLAGTDVARDFVEAPSQMMEEWAWTPAILRELSDHYQTHEKLPKKMLSSMIRARKFNQAYFYMRQLFFASLDMRFHTSADQLDPTRIHDQMYREMIGVDAIEGNHFAAGFGHLMGYDAGYYGYLWAEVYADDLASEFSKKGFLNSELGARYRKIILEQGNMQDAGKLVTDFLGRQHSSDAFFKKLL